MSLEFGRDDRAVSITVAHVLSIAITTILIGMLLTSAGTMLDTEKESSTTTSLETVGERLADEIGNVDRIASGSGDVTVTADHPRTVAGTRYTVDLLEKGTCSQAPLLDDSNHCLRLTADSVDAVVYVPVKIDADVHATEQSARGGLIEIGYDSSDDAISITEGR